ncbi:ROK family transcriptional regulator [Paenibacillus senegalensis]|uniref:ROK family transcriptional regulator n=1 Tax=Paenibacillus senegalensis TaxID=1465766 RepID=UPI000287C372|nr:ROK family transcriptional regulator [Paenibacillus senegalensis]
MKSNLPSTLREMNKALVLNVIREFGPLSRAQISKKTNITRATVSEIVNSLIEEEAVFEIGADNSPIGRKGILLQYNSGLGYGVSVDLGGTKIAFSLFDVNAELMVQRVIPTYRAETNQEFIALLAESIRELIASEGRDINNLMVIGIATPGIVDYENGIVVEGSPNLPQWENLNLGAQMESELGVPVVVENDVRSALIGEIWKGRCQNVENAALIAIGTGIGSAYVIDGQVVRGSGNASGEIGYMLFTREQLRQKWNHKGFFETVCSGSGLMMSVRDSYAMRGQEPPWETTEQVFASAMKGDAEAAQFIDEMTDYLAIAILNFITVNNPEIIVLSGGISLSADYFIDKLREDVNRHTFSKTRVQIATSELREKAPLYGMAILALNHVRPTINFLPNIKLN